MNTKRCPRCGETKPHEEFGNNSGRKDRLNQYCKICHRERLAEYRKNNPKWLEWRRERYKNKIEDERAKSREYYWKNREERVSKVAIYRAANRAVHNNRSKLWYKNNPDKAKAIRARRSALEKLAEGEFSPAEWKDLCIRYDNTCLCCGKKEPEIKLTPDHVVPLSRGGTNYISNIQPLCMPCNRKKMTKSTDFR